LTISSKKERVKIHFHIPGQDKRRGGMYHKRRRGIRSNGARSEERIFLSPIPRGKLGGGKKKTAFIGPRSRCTGGVSAPPEGGKKRDLP